MFLKSIEKNYLFGVKYVAMPHYIVHQEMIRCQQVNINTYADPGRVPLYFFIRILI